MTVHHAACSCGQLSLVAHGDPIRISMCHCLACQRRTGSTYGAQARFPREDVEMAFFSRTDRVTYCPYKGDAHYYTILMDGRFAENAVWTYEEPYPAMETIRGRLAFYPNQVEIYEAGEAADAEAVKAAILHTDDGAGRSQKERWPPTVEAP